MKTIKTSDIKVEFGGINEEADNKMIDLLKDAYRGTLLVQFALINVLGIKPFSNYKPKVSDGFKEYFDNLEKGGTPPAIHVYPKNGYFIMSDDYSAYSLYLQKGYDKIMCIVLGNAEGNFVLEKGEHFKLPPPTAVVITEAKNE